MAPIVVMIGGEPMELPNGMNSVIPRSTVNTGASPVHHPQSVEETTELQGRPYDVVESQRSQFSTTTLQGSQFDTAGPQKSPLDKLGSERDLVDPIGFSDIITTEKVEPLSKTNMFETVESMLTTGSSVNKNVSVEKFDSCAKKTAMGTVASSEVELRQLDNLKLTAITPSSRERQLADDITKSVISRDFKRTHDCSSFVYEKVFERILNDTLALLQENQTSSIDIKRIQELRVEAIYHDELSKEKNSLKFLKVEEESNNKQIGDGKTVKTLVADFLGSQQSLVTTMEHSKINPIKTVVPNLITVGSMKTLAKRGAKKSFAKKTVMGALHDNKKPSNVTENSAKSDMEVADDITNNVVPSNFVKTHKCSDSVYANVCARVHKDTLAMIKERNKSHPEIQQMQALRVEAIYHGEILKEDTEKRSALLMGKSKIKEIDSKEKKELKRISKEIEENQARVLKDKEEKSKTKQKNANKTDALAKLQYSDTESNSEDEEDFTKKLVKSKKKEEPLKVNGYFEYLSQYKNDLEVFNRVKGLEMRGKTYKVSNDGACPRCRYKKNTFVILDFLFVSGDMPEMLQWLLSKGKAVLWSSKSDMNCKDPPTFLCGGRCPTDVSKSGYNINWKSTDLEKIYLYPDVKDGIPKLPDKSPPLEKKPTEPDCIGSSESEHESGTPGLGSTASSLNNNEGTTENDDSSDEYDEGHVDIDHYRNKVTWVVLDEFIDLKSSKISNEESIIRTMLALEEARTDFVKGSMKVKEEKEEVVKTEKIELKKDETHPEMDFDYYNRKSRKEASSQIINRLTTASEIARDIAQSTSKASLISTPATILKKPSLYTGNKKTPTFTAADFPVSSDGACPYCKSKSVVYIIVQNQTDKDEELPLLLSSLLKNGHAKKMKKDTSEIPSFQCKMCTYGFNLDWSKTNLETIFANESTKSVTSIDSSSAYQQPYYAGNGITTNNQQQSLYQQGVYQQGGGYQQAGYQQQYVYPQSEYPQQTGYQQQTGYYQTGYQLPIGYQQQAGYQSQFGYQQQAGYQQSYYGNNWMAGYLPNPMAMMNPFGYSQPYNMGYGYNQPVYIFPPGMGPLANNSMQLSVPNIVQNPIDVTDGQKIRKTRWGSSTVNLVSSESGSTFMELDDADNDIIIIMSEILDQVVENLKDMTGALDITVSEAELETSVCTINKKAPNKVFDIKKIPANVKRERKGKKSLLNLEIANVTDEIETDSITIVNASEQPIETFEKPLLAASPSKKLLRKRQTPKILKVPSKKRNLENDVNTKISVTLAEPSKTVMESGPKVSHTRRSLRGNRTPKTPDMPVKNFKSLRKRHTTNISDETSQINLDINVSKDLAKNLEESTSENFNNKTKSFGPHTLETLDVPTDDMMHDVVPKKGVVMPPDLFEISGEAVNNLSVELSPNLKMEKSSLVQIQQTSKSALESHAENLMQEKMNKESGGISKVIFSAEISPASAPICINALNTAKDKKSKIFETPILDNFNKLKKNSNFTQSDNSIFTELNISKLVEESSFLPEDPLPPAVADSKECEIDENVCKSKEFMKGRPKGRKSRKRNTPKGGNTPMSEGAPIKEIKLDSDISGEMDSLYTDPSCKEYGNAVITPMVECLPDNNKITGKNKIEDIDSPFTDSLLNILNENNTMIEKNSDLLSSEQSDLLSPTGSDMLSPSTPSIEVSEKTLCNVSQISKSAQGKSRRGKGRGKRGRGRKKAL